jgi:hypothetical protein
MAPKEDIISGVSQNIRGRAAPGVEDELIPPLPQPPEKGPGRHAPELHITADMGVDAPHGGVSRADA